MKPDDFARMREQQVRMMMAMQGMPQQQPMPMGCIGRPPGRPNWPEPPDSIPQGDYLEWLRKEQGR